MATAPRLTEEVSQTVSQAMVEAGIGRMDLADRAGISYGTLGRKLAGRTPFDIVDLYLIAKALGRSPRDLLPRAFLHPDQVAA